MDETTTCTVCNAVVPAARSALGKALGTAVFGTIGLTKSSDPIDRFVMFLVGLGLGHVADMVVTELLRPICTGCRSLQPVR